VIRYDPSADTSSSADSGAGAGRASRAARRRPPRRARWDSASSPTSSAATASWSSGSAGFAVDRGAARGRVLGGGDPGQAPEGGLLGVGPVGLGDGLGAPGQEEEPGRAGRAGAVQGVEQRQGGAAAEPEPGLVGIGVAPRALAGRQQGHAPPGVGEAHPVAGLVVVAGGRPGDDEGPEASQGLGHRRGVVGRAQHQPSARLAGDLGDLRPRTPGDAVSPAVAGGPRRAEQGVAGGAAQEQAVDDGEGPAGLVEQADVGDEGGLVARGPQRGVGPARAGGGEAVPGEAVDAEGDVGGGGLGGVVESGGDELEAGVDQSGGQGEPGGVAGLGGTHPGQGLARAPPDRLHPAEPGTKVDTAVPDHLVEVIARPLSVASGLERLE